MVIVKSDTFLSVDLLSIRTPADPRGRPIQSDMCVSLGLDRKRMDCGFVWAFAHRLCSIQFGSISKELCRRFMTLDGLIVI